MIEVFHSSIHKNSIQDCKDATITLQNFVRIGNELNHDHNESSHEKTWI
jgi:hypothetical protein